MENGEGDGDGRAYFVVPFGQVVHVLVIHRAQGVFGDEVDDAGDAFEEAFCCERGSLVKARFRSVEQV